MGVINLELKDPQSKSSMAQTSIIGTQKLENDKGSPLSGTQAGPNLACSNKSTAAKINVFVWGMNCIMERVWKPKQLVNEKESKKQSPLVFS